MFVDVGVGVLVEVAVAVLVDVLVGVAVDGSMPGPYFQIVPPQSTTTRSSAAKACTSMKSAVVDGEVACDQLVPFSVRKMIPEPIQLSEVLSLLLQPTA